MPLSLEHISAAARADRDDLIRIYADWPEALAGGTAAWVDRRLATGGFFAARFNGRLIAAIGSQPDGKTSLRLDHFCVRCITRHRGVGSRLLELVCQEADRRGISLFMHCGESSAAAGVETLLARCNFQPCGDGWLRKGPP